VLLSGRVKGVHFFSNAGHNLEGRVAIFCGKYLTYVSRENIFASSQKSSSMLKVERSQGCIGD
jgi:hypothetical protein